VSRLVDIFLTDDAPRPSVRDQAALEDALAALCARGKAAHPTFGVQDEVFVAHLRRCVGAEGKGLPDALYAEDLYLACACLLANESALVHLRAVCRPVLQRYLSRIRDAGAIFDEVEQRLWDAVLVGTPPRLATYSGRGPLGAWIGVSAQRLALMELRHERAERRARHEVAAQDRLASESPELAAIKQRFRVEFQRAIASAFETLDDRQRMLYRMHLVDGLTLESIAKAYRVHAATVGRWLEAARQQVIDEAKRTLQAALQLKNDEFDSLVRVLISGLDISISQVLKSR
jgi:RNA polymerase sigma-70 factor (ECF subfamily)